MWCQEKGVKLERSTGVFGLGEEGNIFWPSKNKSREASTSTSYLKLSSEIKIIASYSAVKGPVNYEHPSMPFECKFFSV